MQMQPVRMAAKIKLKRKWTTTQYLRLSSLLLFLALTAYAIVRHRINEAAGLSGPANQAPSVDSLSPLGGLETLWTWIQTGDTLNKIHASDLVLLLAAVALVALLGGAFCGWICPFGAIQEWLYRLRSRWIPWKITLPAKLDRVLRYGRYVVLLLLLYFTYAAGEMIFGDYCPWRAAWHLDSDELAVGGAIVLGLVVAGGLLIERFWCRYACPLGGFLGLFNKLAPVRIRRSESTCTACNLCNRKCPMGIDIENADAVTNTTCTRCLECVDTCPKPETLEVKAGRKAIPGTHFGLAAAAIFGGVILLAMATGNWQSTASPESPAVVEATGQLNADDIKGWRTIQEVSDLWGIPLDLLYRELKLDRAALPPSTQLNKLETATGGAIGRLTVVDLVKRWQRGEVN